MDAELVLEAADLDPRPFLDQQTAEATPVRRPLLRTRKNQQHLAAAVGDEALHAVHEPVAVRILIRRRLDALQVAAGIRLGEDHRTRPLAGDKLRNVRLLHFLVAEHVDRVGDALKPEDVHQRRVAARNDVVAGGEDRARHVESAQVIRNLHAEESGLAEKLKRQLDARRIGDGSVRVEHAPDRIGLLRQGRNAIRHHVTADVDRALVVVDCIRRVLRREIILLRELEVLLQERCDFRQVKRVDDVLDVLVVLIKIAHDPPSYKLVGRLYQNIATLR